MHEEDRINKIEYEIEALRKEKKHLIEIRKRVSYNTNTKRAGSQDTILVNISSMIETFQLWFDGFEGSDSPLKSLSERSTVSVKTISEIMHSRRIWVTFDTADRLLSAIGGGWVINDLPQKRNTVGRGKKPESQYYEE